MPSDRKITTGGGYCGQARSFEVIVGRRYRIVPLNPRKKKNRGRECEVTGIRRVGPKKDLYVNVRWLDTGQAGWTSTEDFLPISANPETDSYGYQSDSD